MEAELLRFEKELDALAEETLSDLPPAEAEKLRKKLRELEEEAERPVTTSVYRPPGSRLNATEKDAPAAQPQDASQQHPPSEAAKPAAIEQTAAPPSAASSNLRQRKRRDE
jgi:hypothetical protein